ncbi:MAG TPA: hypothetical protein VKO61_01325 [Candidatus Paceibacterota bacterium]|nr:hypothetical protein [Candidatus Paceibacterota bacterium]
MKKVFLLPRVLKNYRSQFPEESQNAYDYFNYDNRVVEERVDRGDEKSMYKAPDDLTNEDYQCLLDYAKTKIDPILVRYSPSVACEDALMQAIRWFRDGMYDGKINAPRFNTLLKDLMCSPITAKKKSPKKDTRKPLRQQTLRQLGLKTQDIPRSRQLKKPQKGPVLVREERRPSQVVVKQPESKRSTTHNKEADSMLKNPKEYSERLDKVAEEVQNIDPNIALQIDMVSDVIEGRREASSLRWEADESRYMANRFDYRVRSREADEPYMDEYNRSNYEQVMRERRNPKPVRKASVPYKKIQKED